MQEIDKGKICKL